MPTPSLFDALEPPDKAASNSPAQALPVAEPSTSSTGQMAAAAAAPSGATSGATPAATTPPAPAAAPPTARVSPIDLLCQTLEAEHRQTVIEGFHPREDKLWVVRDGARYALSVRKGKAEYPFAPDAIRQFAALLDVPASLLQRLAGFPKVEDCRLLNMLLWSEGARPEAQIQLRIRDGQIIAAHSGTFTAMDPTALARRLAQAEAEGRLRVRRFEVDAGRLWVEIEHVGMAPVDLSPAMDRSTTKADLWRPGAILVNQEDGGLAVTVVPALLRDWHQAALPVVTGRTELRKRRHAQATPDALVRAVMGDLAATREAPFTEMTERLRTAHERFLPSNGVLAHLESLNLPFPNTATRDGVVRQVIAGRPTHFRLVSALLKETKTIPDFGRRLKLGIATSRLLWTRYGTRRPRATGSATPAGPSSTPARRPRPGA